MLHSRAHPENQTLVALTATVRWSPTVADSQFWGGIWPPLGRISCPLTDACEPVRTPKNDSAGFGCESPTRNDPLCHLEHTLCSLTVYCGPRVAVIVAANWPLEKATTRS